MEPDTAMLALIDVMSATHGQPEEQRKDAALRLASLLEDDPAHEDDEEE
jgi:hypothetical protein